VSVVVTGRRLPEGRRCASLAATVVLVAGLVGCDGTPPPAEPSTGVDRQRAELLRAEQVFVGAEPPSVQPGWVHADRILRRTEVSGAVARWPRGAAPDVALQALEDRADTVLAVFRRSGWTVLWSSCSPPTPLSGPMPSRTPLDADEAAQEWRWRAAGYKIVDGVSYWFRLDVRGDRTGAGTARVLLRAPNNEESANLFADVPGGLGSADTCIERAGVPPKVEEEGRYLELAPSFNRVGGSKPPAWR
jgi:hypothetical protein